MKKIGLFGIVLCMIVMMVSPCSAQAMQIEEGKRSEMIDELIFEKMRAYADENYELVDNINEQLEALGAEIMSANEIMEKTYEGTEITPRFTIPISSNTEWTTARYVYTYNGVQYEVQSVFATPMNRNSTLSTAGTNFRKDVAYDVTSALYNVLDVTASTLVSADPVMGFVVTASDFMNAAASGNTSINLIMEGDYFVYDYVYWTSVRFDYVKKVGQDDSSQSLEFVATRGYTDITCLYNTSRETSSGYEPVRYNYTYTVSMQASNYYRPIAETVETYLGLNSVRDSYVGSFPVKAGPNNSESTVFTIYPLTPSGPHHIVY